MISELREGSNRRSQANSFYVAFFRWNAVSILMMILGALSIEMNKSLSFTLISNIYIVIVDVAFLFLAAFYLERGRNFMGEKQLRLVFYGFSILTGVVISLLFRALGVPIFSNLLLSSLVGFAAIEGLVLVADERIPLRFYVVTFVLFSLVADLFIYTMWFHDLMFFVVLVLFTAYCSVVLYFGLRAIELANIQYWYRMQSFEHALYLQVRMVKTWLIWLKELFI